MSEPLSLNDSVVDADSRDDAESPDLDCEAVGYAPPRMVRWIDMTPVERMEQRERAGEEAREYRADSELARKVDYTPMGWFRARKAELSPEAWNRHMADCLSFVHANCVGVAALTESYRRLADMRGDSDAWERAVLALCYALGAEQGEEAAALAEASSSDA